MSKLFKISSWAKIAGLGVIAAVASTSVAEAAAPLKGTIRIDGSSTVFPITEEIGRASCRERV